MARLTSGGVDTTTVGDPSYGSVSPTTDAWNGALSTGDDKIPVTDNAIDVRGALGGQISIQLTTPTVAAGAATFDLSVMGSNDGGTTYDSAAAGSYLAVPAAAQPKALTRSYIVNVGGLTHIKLRLDLNVANMAADENVSAIVTVIR